MAQARTGRGFAALPSSELRRISSAGGRASHRSGHGHEWTSAEAREAGARAVRHGHSEAVPPTTEAADMANMDSTPVDRLRGASSQADEVEPTRTRDRSERADDRVNAQSGPEY